MKQTLTNDLLTVEINSHGAELQSIKSNRTGHQYLWHGDKKFWGRRSPVLFPIVGSLWDGKFRMDGREWAMGQHGFARDCEFAPMENAPADEVWFTLESGEETLAKYPRRFSLSIGYRLEGERLSVMWRVRNNDTADMHFQIGAHPAFNYPEFSPSDSVHGYFQCGLSSLVSEVIENKGCVGDEVVTVELDEHGMIPITGTTFDRDALIFDDGQTHRVSLLDKERRPYLSLLFQAPLVGLWSPCADAPFVCIEPWWGRCDRVGFEGDFSEREHVQTLAPGASFEASYMIIIENV